MEIMRDVIDSVILPFNPSFPFRGDEVLRLYFLVLFSQITINQFPPFVIFFKFCSKDIIYGLIFYQHRWKVSYDENLNLNNQYVVLYFHILSIGEIIKNKLGIHIDKVYSDALSFHVLGFSILHRWLQCCMVG